MSYIVRIGESGYFNANIEQGIPDGCVLAPTPVPKNPIWDEALGNIREKTVAELLADARQVKIKELAEEGLRRCNLVYGDTVFPSIFENAVDVINGLDQAGVDNYNVETDTGWTS